MEILNLPTPTEYTLFMASYRLIINNQNEDIQSAPDNHNLFTYNLAEESTQSPITLQASKSISNPHNFFYFEIQIINAGKWFLIGYSNQGVRAQTIPGRTTLWGFSIGLLVKNDLISLFHRKNKIFEKKIGKANVIGIGISILKMCCFVTLDGQLETEVNLQRVSTCFPSLTITPGAEILVKFTDLKFDVLSYAGQLIESLRKSISPIKSVNDDEDSSRFRTEKARSKINKRKTADMVAEYLKLRGFGKTLEKFKQTELSLKLKGKKIKDTKDKKRTTTKKSSVFSKLRGEIIDEENWGFFLKEKQIEEILSDNLRANIALREMLHVYLSVKNENQRIEVLNNFSSDFGKLKAEEILGTEETLEEVLCNLMCEEKTYQELLNLDQKNEILETFFELLNPKKCELMNVVKYLDALLLTNSQLNGFEPGHSLENFRF